MGVWHELPGSSFNRWRYDPPPVQTFTQVFTGSPGSAADAVSVATSFDWALRTHRAAIGRPCDEDASVPLPTDPLPDEQRLRIVHDTRPISLWLPSLLRHIGAVTCE